jgi:5-hydroxyisourate hydrolase-like protein (transthyretin family)
VWKALAVKALFLGFFRIRLKLRLRQKAQPHHVPVRWSAITANGHVPGVLMAKFAFHAVRLLVLPFMYVTYRKSGRRSEKLNK